MMAMFQTIQSKKDYEGRFDFEVYCQTWAKRKKTDRGDPASGLTRATEYFQGSSQVIHLQLLPVFKDLQSDLNTDLAQGFESYRKLLRTFIDGDQGHWEEYGGGTQNKPASFVNLRVLEKQLREV